MSVSRLILAAATRETPSGTVSNHNLPPQKEARALGEHYLSKVHVVLPVIEEAMFWTSLESVYGALSQYAPPIHHWQLRLVLATSLISRSQRRGDAAHRRAAGFASSALGFAEHVLRLDSIENLQAMLLLIQYAEYDPTWLDDWVLVGAVSRAMADLGLHQDPALKSAVSRRKLEVRRGVYACIYALDRYVHSHISKVMGYVFGELIKY